jgi:hypothetical protein
MHALLMASMLLLAPPTAHASDRARAEAVLTESARQLRWSSTPFRPSDAGRNALAISPSGYDADSDKAVIVYDDPRTASLLLEAIFENGIPRDEFHGKPAAIARQGQKICEAGGTVGWILKFIRWIAKLIKPDIDERLLCVEASGTVTWKCGDTLFIVGSSDANDNSRQIAEAVYARAEAHGLCGQEIAWNKVREKLRKKQRLTSCEFLVYAEKVEELNPDKNWQQIVTAMHHGIYAADTHLNFFGVDLFVDGKENAGWKDVNVPFGSPKFINSTGGTPIDMGHAYAGLRATLNRNNASSWVMSRVNTEWGDKTQVYQEKIEGAAGRAWGNVKWLKNQLPYFGTDQGVRDANAYIEASKKQYDSAESFLPKDQKVGNAGGLYLRSWFIKNPNGKLSDAWRAWFASLGEKC